MKCPKCFWRDYYKICPICDHQILELRNYMKEGFLRCHDCGAVTHKNVKTLETNFDSPPKEENEDEDQLISFPYKSLCIWLFLSLFLMKFLKRYLSCGFIASNYWSRVLIDPC